MTEGKTPARVKTIGVVGGGTSGYFAALALKRHFPGLDVTLIESSSIPIIGVGEATTTTMPPFLHVQLGIDIVDLYREVRPTWKLGIRFDWGLPGDHAFTYPFGDVEPLDAYWHDGDLRRQSLNSMLMFADASPIVRDPHGQPFSLLPSLKFGYHLHNAPFVAFLAKVAAQRGIRHLDATVDVVAAPDGARVDHLRTSDGRELRFDLYVDATGFRSRLVEGALGSPFHSYASSLFCDTAIVADVPQRGGVVHPYTLAETMDHGWCWNIPVEGVDHRGYVYSSAFATAEQATAEMRAKNPGLGEPWTVRFRSGRHAEFLKGNVVAIGNAYGFVEPLESTALHMVILELSYLLQVLEAGHEEPSRVATVNERVGAHWDFLRWFLAVHYKFNRRLDTPFWRACRDDVDVSGVAPVLERYRARGPWEGHLDDACVVADPTFGRGVCLLLMLLGQDVDAPEVPSRRSAEAWAARVAERQALVARAYSHGDALALLRDRPDLLRSFLTARGSWCSSDDPDALLPVKL